MESFTFCQKLLALGKKGEMDTHDLGSDPLIENLPCLGSQPGTKEKQRWLPLRWLAVLTCLLGEGLDCLRSWL